MRSTKFKERGNIMEQKIELVEAYGVSSLYVEIQEITTKKNEEGFKLTDLSIITNSFTGYQNAILVFTKE